MAGQQKPTGSLTIKLIGASGKDDSANPLWDSAFSQGFVKGDLFWWYAVGCLSFQKALLTAPRCCCSRASGPHTARQGTLCSPPILMWYL